MFRILVFVPLFLLLLACSQPTPTPWPTSTPRGPEPTEVVEQPESEATLETPENAEEGPTNDMEPTSEPTPDPNVITTESGLQIKDLVVGDGEEAASGDRVAVHYTGKLLDGTKFDSSLDRGTPFEFTLGSGQVIRGWDEGVATMKVGGKRVLTIPPELAYGDRGAGPIITPGSTLVFDIELLEIK